MQPHRTTLIGLLLFIIAAVNANDLSSLNGNIVVEGDIPDVPANEAPYWWMAKGSPFKRSPNDGGCDDSGCSPVQYNNIDIANNPFLNGNSINDDFNGYTSPSAHQISIAQDKFGGTGSTPSGFIGSTLADNSDNNNAYSSSQFLTGKPFSASPLSASTPSNAQFTPGTYQAPGYLPPESKPIQRIPCNEHGKTCVPKQYCYNGYVNSNEVNGINQNCDARNEICCTIRTPSTPTILSSTPVTLQPGKPFQPQPQTTPCFEENHGCVSPDQCYNGVVTRLTGSESRIPPQKCYAPEVCCRYQDHSPSPNIQKDNYQSTPSIPITSTYRPPVIVSSTQNTPYVPPVVISSTKQPYNPPAIFTTQRPHSQPPVIVTSQRPYSPIGISQQPNPYHPQIVTVTKPPKPFRGEEYIPPKDNHIGEPSNEYPSNYLPPLRGEEEKSEPIGGGSNDNPKVIRPDEAPIPLPPVQCPAAMNCTEFEYCTANGVISKTPVILSKDQQIFRVPLTDCRNIERGFTGKCCRDPDYVDPWPIGILGQYNASILGFDDGSYKPDKTDTRGNKPLTGNSILSLPIGVVGEQTQTTYTRTPGPTHPNTIPIRDKVTPYPNEPITSATSNCATRNINSYPQGPGPIDAKFGEFPWQAMVLKESTKTLLCGGAIINDETVVTAAHCVEGVQPYDVIAKGGEWRLGSDEEPKTYQTVRVKSISYHPSYEPTNYNGDVALLHLETKFKFDTHIGAICIDENELEPSPSTDECLTTGWGKQVLKQHVGNALMHSIPINPLPQSECQNYLGGNGFNPNTAVCGKPQHDACEVDVGSALACTNGNGQYVLKGVYSTENECGSSNQIVTFAKMDTQWIKQATNNPGQPHFDNILNTPEGTYSTRAPSYLPPRI